MLTIISCGLYYQATRTIDRYHYVVLWIQASDTFKVRDSPLHDSNVANGGSQCHAEMSSSFEEFKVSSVAYPQVCTYECLGKGIRKVFYEPKLQMYAVVSELSG